MFLVLVYRVVAPCSFIIVHLCCGGTCYLHIQG